MVSGEYDFLTGAPNAGENKSTADLCFVAEDVLEGVRLAVGTLNRSAEKRLGSRQRLEIAARQFLRWLEELPKAGCRPFVEATEPLKAYRLGRILNDEYALYELTELAPDSRYPVNYVCGHTPPHDTENSDTLPGMEHQKQLYLGYAPPSIGDMNGYAFSLNQLLTLEERQAVRFGAEEAPDVQLPYYRGFPDLASGQPAEPWRY
jgi:hypothetical protein